MGECGDGSVEEADGEHTVCLEALLQMALHGEVLASPLWRLHANIRRRSRSAAASALEDRGRVRGWTSWCCAASSPACAVGRRGANGGNHAGIPTGTMPGPLVWARSWE